jgi:hypothetical protein
MGCGGCFGRSQGGRRFVAIANFRVAVPDSRPEQVDVAWRVYAFSSELATAEKWRPGERLVSGSVPTAVQQGHLLMCSLFLLFMLGRRMLWREVRN